MFNNELVRCIEELSMKRDELHRQVIIEETEKNKILNELRLKTERLAKLNENLAKNFGHKKDLDQRILDTESAYGKIVEGSHTLVQALKQGLQGCQDDPPRS